MKTFTAWTAPLAISCIFLCVDTCQAMELFVKNYREKEGSSQHLYRVTCLTAGVEASCSLKVVSVRTDKSLMACSLSVDSIFENEPAKGDGGGNFVVSITRGACGYTNTYIFSKTGMVQAKTSPVKIPENLKSSCQEFPPMTYQIPPDSDPLDVFSDVPLGACPKIEVKIL